MNFKAFSRNNYLILIIITFIILRIPSLFETFWYGDEGIYGAVAHGILNGKILYAETWDHKPPLIFLIYLLGMPFGAYISILFAKILNIIAGVISIIFLNKIILKFFNSKKISAISLFILTLIFGTTLFEGNTANAENFYIAFNILIFYLLLVKRHFWLAGILTFLSFAIKIPSFAESIYLIFIFFFTYLLENDRKNIIKCIWQIKLGFVLPFFIMILYFLFNSAFWQFLDGVFLVNSGYASSQNETMIILGLEVSPMLFNVFVVITVLSVSSFALWKKQISKIQYFIINLIVIEIFATLISGRNYPHYLIQVFPGFSLLIAYFLHISQAKNLWLKAKNFVVFIIFIHLILITFTKGGGFPVYSPIEEYYPSFVNNLILQKDESFSQRNRDQIKRIEKFSDYYNSNYSLSSQYYFYGNDPWLFPLIQANSVNKFVVWYHLGFNQDYLNQELENIDNAQIAIIDFRVKQNKMVADKVNSEFFVNEVYDDFIIYKRK
jgi:hypothetical protein